MATPHKTDGDNVTQIAAWRETKKADENLAKPPLLSGGGGGGTFDPMEARVTVLEKNFEKIDGKLDKLIDGFNDFRRSTEVKLASIEAELKLKSSASELSEVKGRVASLPTIWQLIGLVFVILGGAFAIVRFGLQQVP